MIVVFAEGACLRSTEWFCDAKNRSVVNRFLILIDTT